MNLLEFTDKGLKQFLNAYDNARTAINDSNYPQMIPLEIENLLFEENIRILDRSITLPEGPFSTRYRFAEKLSEVLGGELIEKHMFNINLWSGLACFYFKDLCMNSRGEYIKGNMRNKLGATERIILNTAGRRIYRHLVWGPVRLYYYCGEASKKILSKKLYKPGEEFEAVASRRNLLSPAGLSICNKIGWDSKRRDWLKGFGSSAGKPWAIRNIALTLNQLAVNYSISDCETEDSQNSLLKIFPRDQLTDIVKTTR
jgi:hypothetical protein